MKNFSIDSQFRIQVHHINTLIDSALTLQKAYEEDEPKLHRIRQYNQNIKRKIQNLKATFDPHQREILIFQGWLKTLTERSERLCKNQLLKEQQVKNRKLEEEVEQERTAQPTSEEVEI